MLLCCVSAMAMAQQAKSPNGRLTVNQQDSGYVVSYDKKPVLQLSRVGIGNALLSPERKMKMTGKVQADYIMLQGKRQHCTNTGNEYRTALDANTDVVLRLYDDGVAFRYELSNLKDEPMPREQTTYRIAEGTRRWIQQWADSYEGFFPLTTTSRIKAERGYSAPSLTKDGFNSRWGYPALLEPADGVFVLLSEANIERRQSASCLYSEGELYTVTPDENKVKLSGTWHTPWRVAIIGSLADVVGSTLITDVSEPGKLDDTSWIQPGVVSWVYWAYNHGSNDYEIIKKYVDLAATLHLPYVLIDAEWDEMKDGKTIEDAVNYAKSKNVRPMIWYNSSVGWIDGAPTPKFRLNKAEDREREFAWCEKIGVAGVKIDFFSGDNQMNMDYCIDLLESAAHHHLLVNFHGATVPRGWQRTYPNLMSTEGVYGAEWYNNVATFTAKAARHNATLPFTRNVIGPMDYTPCAFSDSQHPHITTHAHELALTALFESALQHLADRPESFLAQPAEVRQYLSALPSTWDDTRLVSGYPGESVVIARRKGTAWYVAGINGTDEMKTLATDLGFIGKIKDIKTFADSGDKEQPWRITDGQSLPKSIECLPRGGFVLVIRTK